MAMAHKRRAKSQTAAEDCSCPLRDYCMHIVRQVLIQPKSVSAADKAPAWLLRPAPPWDARLREQGPQRRLPRWPWACAWPQSDTTWSGSDTRPSWVRRRAGAGAAPRPTVNGSLPRQDDHHQLQASICVFQVPEHGLHAVRPLGVFTEARLALDGHARVS